MLKQLSIRNFVLIDRLDVEFEQGMIALTGETGAGKSIVLDALGLALGARSDSAAVRNGEKQADITAEFDLEANPAAKAWLAAQAEPEADSLVLRRVIDVAGKSRAQINGRPASVAELREIGALLLELHAQHEHQALLRLQTQRELLDHYAEATSEAADVRAAYQHLQHERDALTHARLAADAIANERSALEVDLAELRQAKPNAQEWAELSSEQARLSHAKELLQTVEGVRATLIDDDGIAESLSHAANLLASAERIDPALSGIRGMLESAQVQLEETAQSLRQYLARLSLDPERLQETENRLSALFTLARKFRIRPEALAEYWQATEQKLETLSAAQDIDALEKSVQTAREILTQVAAKLSQKRSVSAKKLSTTATAELPDLAMPNAEFSVALTTYESIEATGAEAVEFMFRSHGSLPFFALSKVASGGELARLSLAILVVCGDAAAVPTLVFDEVDVGVGGRVAAQVGRKLQALAATRQVFCVTHMPQVAAHADYHFTVSRDNSISPTTLINSLDRKSRAVEIARMLAGPEVGTATNKLAKELLDTSCRPEE